MGAEQLSLGLAYPPTHVATLSGGLGSALASIEVARRYGTNGLVLLNHDIHPRAEAADVKRFKREVADYIGVPITYANHCQWDTMDHFDVVKQARAFKVKNGQELCTNRLKTEPFAEWLKEYAPPGTCTIYYGFDSTENHRIQRRASILAAQGYRAAFPLAHWPRTILSTTEIGIAPPNTYSTFKHANCVGCLKAGWQHWFVVYATRPDVWARAVEAEDFIGHTIHREMSLEEKAPLFAEMLRAGIDPTEHTPSGEFWSGARKRVRSLPVLAEEAIDARPCACVTKKAPKGRAALPACDCGVAPGAPHVLGCARTSPAGWLDRPLGAPDSPTPRAA